MLKDSSSNVRPVAARDELIQAIEKHDEALEARAKRVVFGISILVAASLIVLALLMWSNRGGATSTGSDEVPTTTESTPEQGSGGSASTLLEQETGNVLLSISSLPSGATVYLDTDSVGVTPLVDYEMAPALWTLSIQKEAYAPFDTVLFIGDHSTFYLSMKPREGVYTADQYEW